MSQRLRTAWEGGRRKLVVYLTAGDPDLATSVDLVCAVADAGAAAGTGALARLRTWRSSPVS